MSGEQRVPASARHVDLLVSGDVLYTLNKDDPIVVNGEVAVKGNTIVYSGPAKDSGFWQPKKTLPGQGKAVMPGFVNCHTHAGSAVFRSQSDDGPGGQALYSVAFRSEKNISVEHWWDLALLGVADMIRSGVTTINDIWYEPEGLAQAAEIAGLRAQIALKVFDVKLEKLYENHYERAATEGENQLRRAVDFVERSTASGTGLVTGRIGPHATDTCSPGLHIEACAEADRLGVGLHTHVAQSRQEVEYCRSAYGKGPAEFLADLGVLSNRSVLAHLTFASESDLDVVAQTQACYAHCPTIYPRRGVYPDLQGIQDRQIVTGIATDWMMNDPFEAMRNAMNAVRLLSGRHDALTSLDAMKLATLGGARVMGIEDQVGSLVTGKKADLIQLDLQRPHFQPFYAEYSSLAYYARASDVVCSVIDGRPVLENDCIVGLDEPYVLDRIRTHQPEWLAVLKRNGGIGVIPGCGCD